MTRPDDEHCWERAVDGEMTLAMAAHFARCPECARRVAQIHAGAAEVRAGAPAPPAGLDERVLAAVARDAAAPARAPARLVQTRWPWGRPAAPALVGAVTALLLFVAALGPALVGDEARAVPVVPLTADCRPPAGGAGRLVVAGVWSGREAQSFARVLQRFEARTGIKVTFAYETHNIAATIRARLARGCAPDVALLPQPGLVADLARRGQIQPLDAKTQATVARNYDAPWRRLGTINGRAYGVWFKAADKSTIWYRPAAFRAAGISAPPRTWTELVADARRLADAGIRPFSIAGAGPWTLTDWFENLLLRSAGPLPYQRLAEHRLSWTDPSVRRVLAQLGSLFGDRSLVGSPTDALNTTFAESVGDVFGARPRAAMVYEADFVRNFLPAAARAAAATGGRSAPRFFDFPATDGGRPGSVVVGGDLAVAFTASRAAQRLVRFLATPEAAQPWAAAGGFLSPNRALPARAYPDALSRRAAQALVRARTVRFDLSDLQPPAFGATAGQGMWRIFQDFLANPSRPDVTAQQLETAATAAWACERAIGGRC